MIVRDVYNIIMQHDIYGKDKPSGGDSASRTGIMALCGSELDRKLLPLFNNGKGVCVRHPTEPDSCDPRNFTRDQLLCYVAGLWSANDKIYIKDARKILIAHLLRFGFCQNTHELHTKKAKLAPPDWLHPGNIWHLILCSRAWYLYWFFPIGIVCQFIDILWHCYVDSDQELNQIFCVTSVSGLLPFLVWLHPGFSTNMRRYWCNWRDQKEIYENILKYVVC